MESIDPFVSLYPRKKKETLSAMFKTDLPKKDRTNRVDGVQEFLDEAVDRFERIPRDDDAAFVDLFGEYAPPRAPSEATEATDQGSNLRQPEDVPKDKLKWRGGFLADADRTLHT